MFSTYLLLFVPKLSKIDEKTHFENFAAYTGFAWDGREGKKIKWYEPGQKTLNILETCSLNNKKNREYILMLKVLLKSSNEKKIFWSGMKISCSKIKYKKTEIHNFLIVI